MYKDHYVATEQFGGVKLCPLFATPEERSKYHSNENMTIKELKSKIDEVLEAMPDIQIAKEFREYQHSKKNMKKQDYVDLLYSVENHHQEQVAVTSVEIVDEYEDVN